MPLPSSNRTCRFPASGSPEQVASSMRRLRRRKAVQQHKPKFLDVLIPPDVRRRTIRPLTAPLQVPNQAAANEPVDLPPGPTRIAVAEVVRPSFQVPVESRNQFRQRGVALMNISHLAQLLPLPGAAGFSISLGPDGSLPDTPALPRSVIDRRRTPS